MPCRSPRDLGAADGADGRAEVFPPSRPRRTGGGDVLRSYERAIALWRAGRIDLESMITHRIRLDGINDALDQMRTGEALRTCIEL